MTIIGITGGTGAGKTTALDVLKDRGALTLDCDAIYHELLDTNADMKDAINARFPGVIENGVLDRKALGKLVFSDEKALSDLNAIAHAFVCDETVRRIDEFESRGGTLAAIDAIALFESGLSELCDKTVAVTAPAGERARRIMAREGIGMEYAMLRINAQKSDDYYKASCDYVLINDCESYEEFHKKCGVFFDAILGGLKNV